MMLFGVMVQRNSRWAWNSRSTWERRRETKMEKWVLQKVGLKLWNSTIGAFGSDSSK